MVSPSPPDPALVRQRFSRPVDPAAVAAQWRARGFSCQRFIDPPGRAWRDFVHDSNELVTVQEGALTLIVEGREQRLAPGDEAFIPRHAVHSVINHHSATTRWLFGYD